MSGNVKNYSKYQWTEFVLFASIMIVGSISICALSMWLYRTDCISHMAYYLIAYGGEFLSIGLAGLCMWRYGMWRINKYYGNKSHG